MAQSPSHKLGQLIGDLLEAMLYEPLKQTADKHGLYLDYKHLRPARNNKHKASWIDHLSNTHDLDYVLERGGTEEAFGTPCAFIETAWRRYTKHSRNKAQEIQGALIPLAETFRNHHPFLGVVLAGIFTDGSLQQLRSHGFNIVYFSYQEICQAFAKVGVDVSFDESTPDKELQKKVHAFQALSQVQKERIITTLRKVKEAELENFLLALEISLGRKISKIYVIPLHGTSTGFDSAGDAITFIQKYDEGKLVGKFIRYEINVEYSNGDSIRANFAEKLTAIDFLKDLMV